MVDKDKKDDSEELEQSPTEDENTGESETPDNTKKKRGLFSRPCEKCKKLEVERDEYMAGWQRAQADYHNLQREVEQQKGDWVLWSELRILEEFIPVYDNFKKAFYHANNTANSGNGETNTPAETVEKQWQNWKKGIEYIMRQYSDILKAHGVEEIKTVGELFDPAKHEAVGEEESAEIPEHHIAREIEGGYVMKGKVVRVAKVVVVKTKS